MKSSAGRTFAAEAARLFAVVVLSFFIVRVSVNLMNQRSDLQLLLGVAGITVTILTWGWTLIRLLAITGFKEDRKPRAEITKREEEP